MTGKTKKRLDVLVCEKGLAKSRERARALIMSGQILVNDTPVDKPGTAVSIDADIVSRAADIPYVSRGGLKLAHAVKAFRIDVFDRFCLDVGASTGGFTDCLLQHGARCVYAVDVGYGQLAWKLRQDPRVIVIERTNIRYATEKELPDPFDLITIDASFISLKIIVPVVLRFLKPNGRILALIKPQFEVGKDQVGKGGVVKDPALHESVIAELGRFFVTCGLSLDSATPSPILGPKGNKEFMALIVPT